MFQLTQKQTTLQYMIKAFAFIFCLHLAFVLHAQKKLSLIVAVGNYPAASGISSIASVNDIPYVKAALRKNGFLDKDIFTLVNAKATKAGILSALDQLIIKAKQGDIVVLHFAMHGQQIRDQKTPELGMDEDDGFDEALIPYDVKKPQFFPGEYEGEKHLRDEELGEKLIKIRNKLGSGGSLLVLLDACHSGNATRATEFATSRGEPIPFFDPENPPRALVTIGKDNFFDSLSSTASNMVVFSGSGPHQQNFQLELNINGKKEEVGSLSYAFYKAMNELPAGSSYNDLFRKIKACIQAYHPTQLPMAEGNGDQMVFSGKYLPARDKINLTALTDAATDTVFKMDRGRMDGLEPGMAVRIFKDDGFFCDGIIRRSDNFLSYGIAARPLQKGQAYEGRAMETGKGKADVAIKIVFDSSDLITRQLADRVKLQLQPYSFISFSGQKDLLLSVEKTGQGLMRISLSDFSERIVYDERVEAGQLTAEQEKELLKAIKNQRRAKYLRLMPDGGALAKFVRVKLIPSTSPADAGELMRDESFTLEIKNLSDDKLFYAVIDLNPANQFSLIYPSEGKEASNYSINKKSSVQRILGIPANSPFGREFIKVLVSKEPLDLRAVFEYRKARAEMNSMEVVFDDLFSEEKSGPGTRAEISSIKAEETGLITLSFLVK